MTKVTFSNFIVFVTPILKNQRAVIYRPQTIGLQSAIIWFSLAKYMV